MAFAITNQTALSEPNQLTTADAAENGKTQIHVGRILSSLVSAFLFFDGSMKLFKPAVVVK